MANATLRARGYHNLKEKDRDKDREPIKNLPRLAEVPGFKIGSQPGLAADSKPSRPGKTRNSL